MMALRQNVQLKLRVLPPERKIQGGTVQEQLWTAIRSNRTFTTTEIAYYASTDDVKVSEIAALRYLQRLYDAGYLTRKCDAVGKAKYWQLVPRMNTGPLAPMLMQVSLVFDRNKRAVTDGPHAEEVL